MSNDYTFACTVLHTRDADGERVTFRAGDVVRPKDGAEYAFADCVVLGFSRPDKFNDVYVKLGRPYCYASCVGTTCAGTLSGVEEYTMSAKQLVEQRVVVGDKFVSAGSTRPHYDSEVIDLTDKYKGADTLDSAVRDRAFQPLS